MNNDYFDITTIKYLQRILRSTVSDYEPLEKHEDGTYTDKEGNKVVFRGANRIMIKNGKPSGEKGEAILKKKGSRKEKFTYKSYTSDQIKNGDFPEYLKKAFAEKACEKLSPSATSIRIADSADADVWVRYKQPGGGSGTIQNPKFKKQQEIKKFELVAFLRQEENVAKIDNLIDTLLEDEKTKDTGTVLLLMRKMGVRIGEEGNTTKVVLTDKDGNKLKDENGKVIKKETPTYGASTLLGKHIKVRKNGVWLDFLGKDGQPQYHKVEDERLAKLLTEAKANVGSKERLFKTDSKKTNKILAQLSREMGWTGDRQMHNHNLRHIKANEIAEKAIGEYLSKNKELPTSAKEYHKTVLQVCKVVSAVLGNKPAQAKESYIDPKVWKRLQREGIDYGE